MIKGTSDLDKALQDLHEKYDIEIPESEAVSTGVLSLDFATDIPGIPRGTIIDLYGKEGLGKTTLVLTMAEERRRNGERVAYIDVEQRLNESLINMNISGAWLNTERTRKENFEIFRPKDGDSALVQVNNLVRLKGISMIVLDSVAALSFKEVMEDLAMEGAHVGLVSRKMSVLFQQIMTPIRENGTIVVFINQMRSKPMQMTRGITDTPTGGNAIKFYASFMMNMIPEQFINEAGTTVGHKVYIVMDKNNYGPKGKRAYMSIMYGFGVDKARDVIECGIQAGLITKSSSWYQYEDVKANGEAALAEKLLPVLPEVQAKIREAYAKSKAEDEKRRRGGNDQVPQT